MKEKLKKYKKGGRFGQPVKVYCNFCNNEVTYLKDSLSICEFLISGFCQKCQDEIFREE